jgi:hypothetical protein
MKNRNPRQRGLYVLGAQGSWKNRVLSRFLSLPDTHTGIPLVLSDLPAKTLSELVKEVFPDATKKQKPSQPKAEDENPDTTV